MRSLARNSAGLQRRTYLVSGSHNKEQSWVHWQHSWAGRAARQGCHRAPLPRLVVSPGFGAPLRSGSRGSSLHSAIGPDEDRSEGHTSQDHSASPSSQIDSIPAAVNSRLTSRGLWQTTWALVKRNFWTVTAIYAVCDALIFLLHRLSHRLTNQAAMSLLRGSVTPESLGNAWWLSNDPTVATFASGYQWMVYAAFALTLPLSILLRTLATSAAMLVCQEENEERLKSRWIPQVRVILAEIAHAQRKLRGEWTRLWEVALQVAVRTVPLQALSLLVLPLPWSLPRLLMLQLALPIAVVEGEHGEHAIKQSQQRLQARLVLKAILLPYVGTLLLGRVATFGSKLALANFPARIWRDVPEVPCVLYACAICTSVLLARLQGLLPLALYNQVEQRRPHPG